MTTYYSARSSRRETVNLSEPVSVVGVCVDEEMWRFLGLFAGSTGLIQLRGRVFEYRDTQDQDSLVESLGRLAPGVCLVDFDKDRHAAAVVVERIHSGLPETAVVCGSAAKRPAGIPWVMGG